jgi:hypothetical protein
VKLLLFKEKMNHRTLLHTHGKEKIIRILAFAFEISISDNRNLENKKIALENLYLLAFGKLFCNENW